jgi:hypothetical protein
VVESGNSAIGAGDNKFQVQDNGKKTWRDQDLVQLPGHSSNRLPGAAQSGGSTAGPATVSSAKTAIVSPTQGSASSAQPVAPTGAEISALGSSASTNASTIIVTPIVGTALGQQASGGLLTSGASSQTALTDMFFSQSAPGSVSEAGTPVSILDSALSGPSSLWEDDGLLNVLPTWWHR